MSEYTAIPVIGYTIAAGNPAEGFGFYGFFESRDDASQSAAEDRTMPADWWILPIYAQEVQP